MDDLANSSGTYAAENNDASNVRDVSDADSCLDRLLQRYSKSQSPIQVNFRTMIGWVPYGERATHMMHLYPAKLLPHIAILFTSNNILSSKKDLVFDPFCGSGTVILEGILHERRAIGSDSNPLARLISTVKTTPLDNKKLRASYNLLQKKFRGKNITTDYPDVINIDHWFHPHVKEQLNDIRLCINSVRTIEYRDFFKVAFSNTIKRVSMADPSVSVPVKLKKEKYAEDTLNYQKTYKRLKMLSEIDVYEVFCRLTESNISRVAALTDSVGLKTNKLKLFNDARDLSSANARQADESVQLIITSPPYSGAQKYIRSSSLNLGWLDFCKSNQLRDYEIKNIGREHYHKNEYQKIPITGVTSADNLLKEIFKTYPLRAHISANYLVEITDAIHEAYRVLKYNGYFVLVIANNRICGKDFLTQKYLRTIMEDCGLEMELCLIDDIHSRGLMTKRNKTANVIASEWIMVFRKVRKYV